jgi:hypothetical protein
MKRALLFFYAASFLALFGSAHAAVVTFEFSGTVTQVPLDDVFGDIAAGDPILGSYTFDTSAVDLIPADAAMSAFAFSAPLGMNVTVGEHEFSARGLLSIGVLNSFADQYTVLARNSGPAGELTLELFLHDPTGGAFINDHLPSAAPPLGGFSQKDFHLIAMLAGAEVQVDGQLSMLNGQATPEPSAASLVIAGSVLLLLARRRRRQ